MRIQSDSGRHITLVNNVPDVRSILAKYFKTLLNFEYREWKAENHSWTGTIKKKIKHKIQNKLSTVLNIYGDRKLYPVGIFRSLIKRYKQTQFHVCCPP